MGAGRRAREGRREGRGREGREGRREGGTENKSGGREGGRGILYNPKLKDHLFPLVSYCVSNLFSALCNPSI